MTNTTYNPTMDEYDPVAATVHHIRVEAPGLVRHDADAVANGWDPYEDPESGYVWRAAEQVLLAASGDEELDDDTYEALVDEIAKYLPEIDEEEE